MGGVALPDLSEVDVLLVEDQPSIVRVLKRVLAPSAARVTEAATLADAKAALQGGWHWGLILLDQKLPDGDALKLLDDLDALDDEGDRPAIVATSGNLQESRRSLRLQEYGAVLLPKPFSGDELLSAIGKAMALRATERQMKTFSSLPPPPPDNGRALAHGPVTLDLLSQTVRVHGAVVDLQPTSFRLLATLLAHLGRALTVEELVEGALRGTHQNGAVNIRFQVHTLRRRLGAAGMLIETTDHGYGIAISKS